MPKCGSQCWLCDLPIRFDTYKGCSHLCKYCFVQKKTDINKIEKGESYKALINFIKGERGNLTRWCDWNIPIHWGGVSDPFQPVERFEKRSLKALQVFAETKYPVVISTKGILCIEEPYLSLIKQSNCVMQISMICDKYDVLEQGAPTYKQRLEMVRILSKNAKRVVIRVQPYMHEALNDVLENIADWANAGAYGAILEGMKFYKKQDGLEKLAGDWVYPMNVLKKDFEKIKKELHKNGMKFYSGENRLRNMGDSLTCCGIDGLDGFIPNTFNLSHILNGDKPIPSKAQMTVGGAACFAASFGQTTACNKFLESQSFASAMEYFATNRQDVINKVLKG